MIFDKMISWGKATGKWWLVCKVSIPIWHIPTYQWSEHTGCKAEM